MGKIITCRKQRYKKHLEFAEAMDILTKEEFVVDSYINKILDGVLFIHPTDTIYGIACDATNEKSVKKVREIKQQTDRPFSVVAPSKEWINANCSTNSKEQEWIDKLPGPYTLILRLKNKYAVSKETNLGLPTLGVRIPDHWISALTKEIGRPLITTSANLAGEDFMTTTDDLNPKIASRMSFAIYEGPKKGRPSKLIDLTKEKIRVIER